MKQHKIVPCLWFHTEGGKISEVTNYYQNIFGENIQVGRIMPLGETPTGYTEMCEVHIFERKYNFMSTANPHHLFNDALAFAINCKDQDEIDKFWNYFTQDGKEVQCGCCIDKFGLRWQVLPENLGLLMSKPNSFEIMMKQKKIIIEAYL
ncbi:MAG: VOC family protein [Bacteroidetes bacterium]|nr:VOC family protein [Bacteroidota bacterium]